MLMQWDHTLPEFAHRCSVQIHPGSRITAGEIGAMAVRKRNTRLSATITANMTVFPADFAQFDVFRAGLNDGRSPFRCAHLEQLLGIDDAAHLRIKGDPESVNHGSVYSVSFSLKLLARMITSPVDDFMPCRYLLREFTLTPFSKNKEMQTLGGDLFKVGALLGDQYTLAVSWKLPTEVLPDFLRWYVVDLESGAKPLDISTLATQDDRLNNKRIKFAGGFTIQIADGLALIDAKLWAGEQHGNV